MLVFSPTLFILVRQLGANKEKINEKTSLGENYRYGWKQPPPSSLGNGPKNRIHRGRGEPLTPLRGRDDTPVLSLLS